MKKYNLKPGRHQFVPGSPAEHTNDSLTDAEAEWYLQRYPHLAKLFDECPAVCGADGQEGSQNAKPKAKKKREQTVSRNR